MKKYTFTVIIAILLPFLSIGQGTLTLNITGYDAKCNGSANGSAVAIPAGGFAPYSYQWTSAAGSSDSVSGLAAGIYSVTVTDNSGNTVSGSVTINQPAPLIVSIDSIVVFPCFKPTGGACGTCSNVLWAVVSGGTPPYSYLWSPGTIGDSTGDTLNSACYVLYSVMVTDHNNCVSSDSLNVTIPDPNDDGEGVAALNNTHTILLYPNPANNQLNISINKSITAANSLEVYDMIGRKVLARQLSGNESLITIDISTLTNGDYLLRMAGDKSQTTAHFSILR